MAIFVGASEMVKYNEFVIRKFAERLYSRARTIVALYTLVFALLGASGGGVLGLSLPGYEWVIAGVQRGHLRIDRLCSGDESRVLAAAAGADCVVPGADREEHTGRMMRSHVRPGQRRSAFSTRPAPMTPTTVAQVWSGASTKQCKAVEIGSPGWMRSR